jgi:hypothetical protein
MRICFANAALLFVAVCSGAHAWEATRPGPLLFSATATDSKAGADDKSAAVPFSFARRVVEYPIDTGAQLGDGWDFAANRRVYTQCIEFGEKGKDDFQQATLTFHHAIDDESLSVALNMNMSASASVGFAGIGGNASSSLNFEASLHTTSKDELVVAHASVVNGARYVTSVDPAGKDARNDRGANPLLSGIRLTTTAEKLLSGVDENLDKFRAACGDGFVAAIGSGADLYVIYQFRDISSEERFKLKAAMSAGGGIAGFASASASGDATTSFSKVVTNANLNLYVFQNGGRIELIPTKLDQLESRIQSLPREARDGPRPSFVLAVPYSELSNWKQNTSSLSQLGVRSALVRMNQRLRYAYLETKAVFDDYQTTDSGKRTYLQDTVHSLRSVDYAGQLDEIRKEGDLVNELLAKYDANCTPTDRIEVKTSGSGGRKQACDTTLKKAINQVKVFDDFAYLAKLPPPKEALDNGALMKITSNPNDENARYLLSKAIYLFRIAPLDRRRCEMFGECLDRDRRTKIYDKIFQSFRDKT